MTYSTAHKSARMTTTRDRLNAGALQVVDAGGAVLFTVPLDNPCGSVSGAVLTMSGFPKTVTASGGGTAAAARLQNASSVDEKTGLTVGVPGSNAQVVIDNGSGTLAIALGASVTVSGSPAPTLTHAA